MDKQEYPVLAEGWLEDALGIGAYRKVGDTVLLSKEQAEYLKASGQIGAAPAKKPAGRSGQRGDPPPEA